MPLYEYQCAACGERTEKMRSLSERTAALACPACGESMALALSVPGRAAVSSGSGASLPTMNTGGCGCGPGGCGASFN